MDYETLDWEAETQRIAWAFGVVGEYDLSVEDPHDGFVFSPKYCLHATEVTGGYYLNVEYTEDYRRYEIFQEWKPQQRISLSLDWEGRPLPKYEPQPDAELLARALFHLDLLSPEVEATLNIRYGVQEKLDLASEYQQRMKHRSIDWEFEAMRLARVFGIEAKCRFEETELDRRAFFADSNNSDQPNKTSISSHVDLSCYWSWIELWICVTDDRLGSSFILISSDGHFQINFNQTLSTSMILAKGLFYLDLLTPEIEAALKLSISAHERLEWTLEYETRYGFG